MVLAKLLHDLDQARDIVRDHSGPVLFLSPPGGIEFGGPGFYLEILKRLQDEFQDRDIELLLDCGDNGALATEAIRLGANDVHFNGHPDASQSIRVIAKEAKARFWVTLPESN